MREKKIRQLIKILDDTGIDEIEIRRWWGERIRVAKNGSANKVEIPDSKSEIHEDIAPLLKQSDHEQEKPYTVVSSPMVGTFYRAPAPDDPPFISVGDTVKVGQTLCIIEAMKVMNEIESEVSGTIVETLIDNALPVEYNQPLFYIDESKK